MYLFGKSYNWQFAGIFGLIVLVIAYYLGNKTGKGKAANEPVKDLNKSDLTYENSDYTSFADRLYIAMSGLMGDDEETIYSVISKLRTKSDVLQLIKSYGTRRLQWTLGNSNLNEWFNYRLNKEEISKVNDILGRNSIQYQF